MTGRSPQGMRPAFRRWRARRPFWGGLLLTLGGAEVLLTMKASMKVVMHVGMQGLAGYLLPTVMLLCGLLTLFSPAQRIFYSLIGVLASLATWLTSNLGGFFIGLLLGLIGSSLTFGWLPDQEPRVSRRRRRREQEAARATAPALAEDTAEPA
ncbi:DUF6114 domain-containing protein [Streptomyces sp. HUAS TT20]|uniref:DUF6114 domain-containing protein n=1 Tax=Streptomyces sp. HUAS TT20 TaxID=3447509 RepID=UPI0021D90512|nr:DUF6114 domain-containing protein [Streptomyces sp. HUAS 15-9]UXY30644.1 DUF6114 domain-containing protein [Streptomyces sp. HUAS 15-9]